MSARESLEDLRSKLEKSETSRAKLRSALQILQERAVNTELLVQRLQQAEADLAKERDKPASSTITKASASRKELNALQSEVADLKKQLLGKDRMVSSLMEQNANLTKILQRLSGVPTADLPNLESNYVPPDESAEQLEVADKKTKKPSPLNAAAEAVRFRAVAAKKAAGGSDKKRCPPTNQLASLSKRQKPTEMAAHMSLHDILTPILASQMTAGKMSSIADALVSMTPHPCTLQDIYAALMEEVVAMVAPVPQQTSAAMYVDGWFDDGDAATNAVLYAPTWLKKSIAKGNGIPWILVLLQHVDTVCRERCITDTFSSELQRYFAKEIISSMGKTPKMKRSLGEECALAVMFTALCRMTGEIQSVLVFLLDIVYLYKESECKRLNAVAVLMTVLQVWPKVFQLCTDKGGHGAWLQRLVVAVCLEEGQKSRDIHLKTALQSLKELEAEFWHLDKKSASKSSEELWTRVRKRVVAEKPFTKPNIELQTGEMKALVVGTLLCSALSWIILLAGVAAMQANCSADNLLFGGTAGYNGPVDCSNFFGYAWWITWFQFVMIIVVAVALASLERFKALLLAFLAMVTVLLMDTSNSYLYYNNLRVANAGLVGLSSPRTASAGAIMSTIFNFILMILVGIYDDDTGAGFKQGPAAAAPPVGTSAQV